LRIGRRLLLGHRRLHGRAAMEVPRHAGHPVRGDLRARLLRADLLLQSDGHLYALNRVTGKLKWSARTTAASGDNSPVAFQNRLFVAAGSQIYSFRPRTGVVESLTAPDQAPDADIT